MRKWILLSVLLKNNENLLHHFDDFKAREERSESYLLAATSQV